MIIAVSADCFASYTSGFPVRGMTLELIRQNPKVSFQLYYTRREWPKTLESFYEEINSMPNAEVRFFKGSRKTIAVKRLLGLKYVTFDDDVDLFLSPGNPEYIKGYKGPSVCSLADLSTIKGISTNRYALFFKHWVKWQWRRTLPWTTRIITISDFTRNDVAEYFPDVAEKTITVHNGIGDNWFKDDDLTNLSIPKQVPESYFIWWGFISRRKNIDRLVRAYKLAKSKCESLPKLLLVGKLAEHMEYLKADFGDDIINIPFQDDITLKALVKNSAGLIFPSLYEGFGLPVVEAFSQGINVACSNVTSLPEVAGGNAILFDPESVGAISNALMQLHESKEQRERLIGYSQQFSYSRAAHRYMEIIKELVK